MTEDHPVVLWEPSAERKAQANLTRFAHEVNTRWSAGCSDHLSLYAWSIREPEKFWQSVWSFAGVIGDEVYEQRLTTIDLTTNALTQVTPADVYIYEYDWTPDSKGWVVSAAHGSGDNNWWLARLYAVDAGSGESKILEM
jgi:hypothetical protein